MEFSGSFNVKVKKAVQVENQNKDGQQVQVDCLLTLTPDEAEEHFGEAFHHVAFACMRNQIEPHDDGDVTITTFGYASKKPPKWLRASVHNFNLWGVKDKGQPQIQKFIAGDDLEQVTVALRFLVDGLDDVERIGALGAAVGHSRKVTLKPLKAAAFPARPPQKTKAKKAPETKKPPKRKGRGNGTKASLSVVPPT